MRLRSTFGVKRTSPSSANRTTNPFAARSITFCRYNKIMLGAAGPSMAVSKTAIFE